MTPTQPNSPHRQRGTAHKRVPGAEFSLPKCEPHTSESLRLAHTKELVAESLRGTTAELQVHIARELATILKSKFDKGVSENKIPRYGLLSGLSIATLTGIGEARSSLLGVSAATICLCRGAFYSNPSSVTKKYYQRFNSTAEQAHYGITESLELILARLAKFCTTSLPGEHTIERQRTLILGSENFWKNMLAIEEYVCNESRGSTLQYKMVMGYLRVLKLLTGLALDYVAKRSALYKTNEPDYAHHDLEDYREGIIQLITEVKDSMRPHSFAPPDPLHAPELHDSGYRNVSFIDWLLVRTPSLKRNSAPVST